MGFLLHDRLAADTVEVLRWPLCRVLLMTDATYPWLILVPERPDVSELFQLNPTDRHLLIEETTSASLALQRLFQADKMNVATLGNVVSQLHVHVIARHRGDPAWPRPVWGAVPAKPYTADALADRLALLRGALSA
jgi:diadenosine tetraphosphate (Ap4A) HIT family hydrolase